MDGQRQPDIEQLRNWIAENTTAARIVDDDEDLFESHALDSLSFVQFIYFLEEVFDIEIVLDENIADNFRSLSAICRYFNVGSRTAEAGVG